MNNTRRKRINELKTQIDFANSTLKEVSKKLSSILNEIFHKINGSAF